MIGLAFALLAVAAAAVAVFPLLAPRLRAPGADREAEFHRAQLAEIARDVERGVLPEAEAAAARAEAGRRLIAASEAAKAALSAPVAPRVAMAAVLALALVAIAGGVYAWLGAPNVPDQPLAARQSAPQGEDPVAAAIAHVEAETRADPDNLQAWSALAPVYIRMGRYSEAVTSFRNVLRLKGEDGEIRADLGEAETAAAGGHVTPEAKADFEKALALVPGSPMARFYLALADEQAGDKDKAAAVYRDLIDKTADKPAWQQIIRNHLAALEGKPQPQAAEPQASDAQGGAQPDAIRSMVSRLAERLASQGGSADEWRRLVHAYTVLGETDKAADALAAARKALANDATGLAALNADAQPQAAEPPASDAQGGAQPDMIRGMVSRLAERLASKGGSADEWQRLVRAYTVLGQTDKATEALTTARKALASDASGLAALNAEAQSLGLGTP